jgi:hypothetical protein
MVHRYSGGIPRIINNICDNALLTGYGESSETITPAIIKEVVEVLDLTSIEIVSESTVAASGLDASLFHVQSDKPSERPANVHYIRRDREAGRMNQSNERSPKFSLWSEAKNSETELKFFSRVRAIRN